MKIWIDADACPVAIKNIIYKAAVRTQTPVTLVTNQILQAPPSPYIKIIRVMAGFDVADNEIVNRMTSGDLIVTADIPLANAVVEKGGVALNPRGELYTLENIKQRLAMRDFSEHLRSTGIQTKRIPKLSPKEIQAFANSLDRILTKKQKPGI